MAKLTSISIQFSVTRYPQKSLPYSCLSIPDGILPYRLNLSCSLVIEFTGTFIQASIGKETFKQVGSGSFGCASTLMPTRACCFSLGNVFC